MSKGFDLHYYHTLSSGCPAIDQASSTGKVLTGVIILALLRVCEHCESVCYGKVGRNGRPRQNAVEGKRKERRKSVNMANIHHQTV